MEWPCTWGGGRICWRERFSEPTQSRLQGGSELGPRSRKGDERHLLQETGKWVVGSKYLVNSGDLGKEPFVKKDPQKLSSHWPKSSRVRPTFSRAWGVFSHHRQWLVNLRWRLGFHIVRVKTG